ncbi:MAG TPA: hypothetical protein VFS16_10690, partial [Acidimicrobiia bacterium]|nr:hypothetical protein [Acidimicrobiia bacterium]
MSRRVPAKTVWLGALSAAVLVAAGCGSNVDEARLDRAANKGGESASAAAPAAVEGGGVPAGDVPAGSAAADDTAAAG